MDSALLSGCGSLWTKHSQPLSCEKQSLGSVSFILVFLGPCWGARLRGPSVHFCHLYQGEGRASHKWHVTSCWRPEVWSLTASRCPPFRTATCNNLNRYSLINPPFLCNTAGLIPISQKNSKTPLGQGSPCHTSVEQWGLEPIVKAHVGFLPQSDIAEERKQLLPLHSPQMWSARKPVRWSEAGMKLLIPCALHTPLPAFFPPPSYHPTSVREVFGFNHLKLTWERT